MKRQLYLVIITVLAVAVAGPTQANPHYSNFNGSKFKADTQEGGWSLIQEDFTNLPATDGFEMHILAHTVHIDHTDGDLGVQLNPDQFVKFSFDQEIAAFGFDYGKAGVSESIKMEVFNSSGREIPFLSQMVPASNDLTNFYGIVDKNFPLQFQTITFVNVGPERATWGIDNLYYAPVVPLPAASWMALPLLGILGVISRVRRMRRGA